MPEERKSRLWLAEKRHAEQRPAVPTFAPLVDKNDELLVAFGIVQPTERALVVVAGDLGVTDVDKDAACRDTSFYQHSLDRWLQFIHGFFDGRGEESHFGHKAFGHKVGSLFAEIIDRDFHKLGRAGVCIAFEINQFEVLIADRLLQAVGIYHLGQDGAADVGGAGEVEAGDHLRASRF